MKNQRTDNSESDIKIGVRLSALDSIIDKDEICVLDAFHGKGFLWDKIKGNTDAKLIVHGIEKEKGKASNVFEGDNRKVIPRLDLSTYDIIDLDSYGTPFDQLKAVFGNSTCKGRIVIYTYIITAQGSSNKKMLEAVGITKAMYRKAPLLCSSKQILAFYNLLWYNNVNRVYETYKQKGTSKKRYGWFRIPE